MEDWVTIRNLKKKNPSLGTRAISKLVGVSRSTVKKALGSEQCPRYSRDKKVNTAIEPFKEYIKESYIIKKQKVSVILESLRSKGFSGSGISLYRYIGEHLKPEKENGRAFMPYETLPGEQMLYDWSEYSVKLGSELVKVYVHLTELGWSRYKVLSASLTIKQSDVLEAMEDAFSHLGGVASRIQVDNARAFVDDASVAHFQWNKRYLEFLGFYGTHPTRSLPGHPWSKGKVERPFAYIEDHFIMNRHFTSFNQFFQQLKAFQNDINGKIHGVTGRAPLELYEKEKAQLLELPKNKSTGELQRYVGYREESRKVTGDCLIAYGGNRYSVPCLYAGQEVWVRTSRGVRLLAFSKAGKLIATHDLKAGRGHVIIQKEHYRGYIRSKDRESFFITGERLKERFQSYERMEEFLLGAKAQKRINPDYNLYMIRRLFEDYADQDCVTAMKECFRYNCFSYAFVKGFLTAHAKVMVDLKPSARWHELLTFSADVKRDLKEYSL
jgi:transposase